MSTENLENELYRTYDTVVGKILTELASYDVIRLAGFDRKNKEHLLILRVALIVRDFYDTPIELGIPWWDGVVVNWKIHKSFERIKIINRFEPNHIWVPSLVKKIKSEIKAERDICVHLDDVYDTYYEGSCG